MGKINFLGILYRFRKLIVSFSIIAGLFSFYNIFLIDRSLENLRFSLEQTALAYDLKDLEGLDIVLNDALTGELLKPSLNSKNLADLEYAMGVLTTGKSWQQIDYIKVALSDIMNDKERQRGIFLMISDNINAALRKGVAYLLNRGRSLLKVRKAKEYVKVDVKLFNKARTLEKDGKLRAAAACYNEFILKYSGYEKIASVKLRLAYTYHRLREYNKAVPLYREIIRTYFTQKESDIARLLLFKLQESIPLLKKMDTLLVKSSEISEADKKARQDVFYQLAINSAQVFNLQDAKKFFKRAVNADPRSDTAVKANFNSAWINKQEDKLDLSLSEFSKIIEENPNSPLVRDCRYQIADVAHKQGKYQEAIDLYIKLSEDYGKDPLAALCLFQAGASYMYDLNDDMKAREIFGRLTREYPASTYAKYLAPSNPLGLFLTYLVPRATRVVAWRAGGLLCLTGYSGEIAKFKVRLDEKAFNQTFNDWLKKELPDTIGNLYVDIKGTEFNFLDGKATGSGRITMGKFNVGGEAEGHLEIPKEGGINLVITKAFLEKIPIPPMLINNALTGLSLIFRKHFPIIVSSISMKKGEISADGIASKRMIEHLKKVSTKLLGIEIDIEDIKDPNEQKDLYNLFKEKFPESDFSPLLKDDTESLFLDFFTRMYLYLGFKLLETTKDTKLDYERSIRTVGRLLVKKSKFGVYYKEKDINNCLMQLITNEFPWLVNEEFLFDVKGLEIHYKNNGDIEFDTEINMSRSGLQVRNYEGVKVEGTAVLDIDKESKIPRMVFKEVGLNGKPFPVERLNLVSLRCLNLLKDGRLPFGLDEVKVYEGGIDLKGEGARDLTARIFSDPQLFTIFQVRIWDLWAAGIQRLKERPANIGDFWRGRAYGFEKEVAVTGGQTGVGYKEYQEPQ